MSLTEINCKIRERKENRFYIKNHLANFIAENHALRKLWTCWTCRWIMHEYNFWTVKSNVYQRLKFCEKAMAHGQERGNRWLIVIFLVHINDQAGFRYLRLQSFTSDWHYFLCNLYETLTLQISILNHLLGSLLIETDSENYPTKKKIRCDIKSLI